MSHREYQKKIAEKLQKIFSDDLVKTEWDSVTYDGHMHNHKTFYAPLHDVAVGPFNSYFNIDDVYVPFGRSGTDSVKQSGGKKKDKGWRYFEI